MMSRTLDRHIEEVDFPGLLDPMLMKAARQIYQTYCKLHCRITKFPVGVAVDRDTYRGQLVFRQKPILLPGESFIPINQIDAEIY